VYIGNKVKNMLIKLKEGLFISAFRENLYRAESNITELIFRSGISRAYGRE